MKRGLMLGLSVLFWGAGASLLWADVPHLIRYQGTLADTQQVSLEGPYTLTFRLYDAATGGTKVWEETQTNVPCTQGQFSVLLGQVTPLDLPFDQDLWLSIEINTDGEMSPRQRLSSVPYAYRADIANAVQGQGTSLVTVSTTPAPNTVPVLDQNAQLNPAIIPQGSGSGLDADTVDGKHASDLVKINDMASGDLSGTYPNPTVAKLQGRDVASGAPTDGQVWRWSSANKRWEPSATVSAQDIYTAMCGINRSGSNGSTGGEHLLFTVENVVVSGNPNIKLLLDYKFQASDEPPLHTHTLRVYVGSTLVHSNGFPQTEARVITSADLSGIPPGTYQIKVTDTPNRNGGYRLSVREFSMWQGIP